ncbi:Hypothetical predicted protein [Cloeon dipterum]|uniref:Uncharacterized protein n=1 Tax=Cloeon dipterum TaxID=197152 RepID=A0A8S1DL34_9INSE|nr:Hypothetical predicted protein [Cloeon dipterum]
MAGDSPQVLPPLNADAVILVYEIRSRVYPEAITAKKLCTDGSGICDEVAGDLFTITECDGVKTQVGIAIDSVLTHGSKSHRLRGFEIEAIARFTRPKAAQSLCPSAASSVKCRRPTTEHERHRSRLVTRSEGSQGPWTGLDWTVSCNKYTDTIQTPRKGVESLMERAKRTEVMSRGAQKR